MKKALPILYILFAVLLLVPLISGIVQIIKLLNDDSNQAAYIFGYVLVYMAMLLLIWFLVIKGIRMIGRFRNED